MKKIIIFIITIIFGIMFNVTTVGETYHEDKKETAIQSQKNISVSKPIKVISTIKPEKKKTSEKTSDVKGAKTKKTKIKYTKACLNCKKKGRAAAKTKFVIPSNSKVRVLSSPNKRGWTKIKYSKEKGYVMNRYLTSKKPKQKKNEINIKNNSSDITNSDKNDDKYMRSLALDTFNKINEIRQNNGLKKLKWDKTLVKVSDTRAYEASIKWSHMRPDGTSWQTVSDNCQGENLARRFSTVETVVEGWMNSQGHKENILRKEFTRASISVCEINGMYYWCQSFGY